MFEAHSRSIAQWETMQYPWLPVIEARHLAGPLDPEIGANQSKPCRLPLASKSSH